MRLFKLTIAVYLCLCCGCVQFIVTDKKVQYNSFLKDISYKELESISNKVKAKATVEMPPTIEIESN